MLSLTKAQVWKFKSIDDSTPVPIGTDVTVLVGKNESGKTAFLEALHKSLPCAGSAKFNYIYDYPRKDLVQYKRQHEAGHHETIVQLTFSIKESLAEIINKQEFNGAEIISDGCTFTRSTKIDNSTQIQLCIDHRAALTALQTPFKAIEHGKDVFKDAERLEDVLSNIEALGLPSENMLATFAAKWQESSAKSEMGLIASYLWDRYLQRALPKFLYFDDYKILKGKINLASLKKQVDTGKTDEADETALGLLELAGTTLAELMSEDGYEAGKAKLEAIGLNITSKVFRFWKQNRDLNVEFDVKNDPKDVAPYNSGPNLYIRIKNQRHGVTVPFDQRSKGFIWFFSFLVWFDAVQSRASTNDALILLLDEPGLNLHALAQADFLAYIRELSTQHQIIYTTHSPFMVESAGLKDVRVVEDREKEGTKITSELAGSSEESLFPLQAALGYSIAQNLFIAKKNILVEGPADLILLQHMGAILESCGKQGLGDAILVPVGGLDKLSTFVALLGSNRLRILVLHDRGASPHQKLDDLIRQKVIERRRVLDFASFMEPVPSEADIEDLLPVGPYIDAFNIVYGPVLRGAKLKLGDLGKHPRIIERINQWLKKKRK